jgi:hypothetical protein
VFLNEFIKNLLLVNASLVANPSVVDMGPYGPSFPFRRRLDWLPIKRGLCLGPTLFFALSSLYSAYRRTVSSNTVVKPIQEVLRFGESVGGSFT